MFLQISLKVESPSVNISVKVPRGTVMRMLVSAVLPMFAGYRAQIKTVQSSRCFCQSTRHFHFPSSIRHVYPQPHEPTHRAILRPSFSLGRQTIHPSPRQSYSSFPSPRPSQ